MIIDASVTVEKISGICRRKPGQASRMMTGGCRCGATRYTLAGDTIAPVYCCHCLDCQSRSGSAFGEQAVVREDAISVTGPVVGGGVPSFAENAPPAEFIAILSRPNP